MQRPHAQALVHGAVGGMIAGAVVALWFLALDLATTRLFHTPAALATAVLGPDSTASTPRIVATYTLLHFGVFVLLGMGAALLVRAVGVSPGLLVGAVFGIGVLNSVYYGALLVIGANVLGVLPGPHVLAANLAGGMLMMVYLHYAMRAERPLGPAVLRAHPTLSEGLVTGLIGAGAVALWFFILDILRGTPFYTPAALGSVVFFGAESPADVKVNPGVIAAYTVLHLAAFASVGTALVLAAHWLVRLPSLWLMGVLVLIILEGLFLGVVGSLSGWVLGAMGMWAVGIGNVVAVAAMGAWVWRRHPEFRRELLEVPPNPAL
jgi:hypothetical protein